MPKEDVERVEESMQDAPATDEEEKKRDPSKQRITPTRSDGITRRALCIGGGATAVMLGLGCLRYAGYNPIPRPPGGQDEMRLIATCIRCQRCYEACPRHVIVPAHIEDGILGMRSPSLDFDNNHCDFCTEENGGEPLCVKLCPTGALTLEEGATAETTLLGLAVLDRSTCLAYRETGCRECYDACPYEAIELDSNSRPSVITDHCNGCGACEAACVSLKAGSIVAGATERAIVVRSLEAVEEG